MHDIDRFRDIEYFRQNLYDALMAGKTERDVALLRKQIEMLEQALRQLDE